MNTIVLSLGNIFAHAGNLPAKTFLDLPEEMRKILITGFILSFESSMKWQLFESKKMNKEEMLKTSSAIDVAIGNVDWQKFAVECATKLKDSKDDDFHWFLYMLAHAKVGSLLQKEGFKFPF